MAAAEQEKEAFIKRLHWAEKHCPPLLPPFRPEDAPLGPGEDEVSDSVVRPTGGGAALCMALLGQASPSSSFSVLSEVGVLCHADVVARAQMLLGRLPTHAVSMPRQPQATVCRSTRVYVV
jgi:hypothetical protein